MKTYDALVIFPFHTGPEALQASSNLFEEAVKREGGKIVSKSELGRRPIGYTVKKAKEGYFVSFVFELAPEKMSALNRALLLAEGILKFTITVKQPVKPRKPRRLKSRPPHDARLSAKPREAAGPKHAAPAGSPRGGAGQKQ